MVDWQSGRCSVFLRRLRLQVLEDRWSLGGAGYLGASFGPENGVRSSIGIHETVASTGEHAQPVRPDSLGVSVFTGSDNPEHIAEHVSDRTPAEGAPGPSRNDYAVVLRAGEENAPFAGFPGLPGTVADSAIGNQNGTGFPGSIGLDSSTHPNAIAGGADAAPMTDRVGDSARSNAASAGGPSLTPSTAPSSIAAGAPAASASHVAVGGKTPPSTRFAASISAGDLDVASVTPITARNRQAVTMSGGWNPALRSIMVMSDGSRWFAAERGTSVQVDSSMVFYRLGPDGWKAAGSVVLPAGIQQNMAIITNGRTIYAYGCAGGSVIEAWFNTAKPRWGLHAANTLWAGGSLIQPGRNSNYIGAAWHDNTRIVWWTTVGPGGSGGSWTYTFNRGRGWNGPITSGLGGYNYVGYVHAQFDGPSQIRMIGESYLGQYPYGRPLLASTTLKLGRGCRWTPMLRRIADAPLGIWQQDAGSATQFLYRTYSHKIGYSSGSGTSGNSTTFGATQARFIVDQDNFGLVLGYKSYLEVRLVPRSAATGFIDWNAIQPITMNLPQALKSSGVSAIWDVDESKQPNDSNRLEFAVCGAYPKRDQLIYYYRVNRA